MDEAKFKASLIGELEALRKPKEAIFLDLYHLAGQLKNQRAKTFLLEGVMRRLNVVEHCSESIFKLFPPQQKAVLPKLAANDVTVNLHAFVINVYGILDNVAWVCALEGQFPEPDKHQTKVGLYRKEMKPYLPEELSNHMEMASSKNWFDNYAKIYRDSAAHRIPPYLPPLGFTKEEATRYQALDASAWEALKTHNFESMERLNAEKATLGSALPMVALSITGEDRKEPLWMHPQLLCDVLTIHEILTIFAAGMRMKHNLPQFVLKQFM